MSYDNMKGAPLLAAFIVLVAVVLLGSLNFSFSGSIQF